MKKTNNINQRKTTKMKKLNKEMYNQNIQSFGRKIRNPEVIILNASNLPKLGMNIPSVKALLQTKVHICGFTPTKFRGSQKKIPNVFAMNTAI